MHSCGLRLTIGQDDFRSLLDKHEAAAATCRGHRPIFFYMENRVNNKIIKYSPPANINNKLNMSDVSLDFPDSDPKRSDKKYPACGLIICIALSLSLTTAACLVFGGQNHQIQLLPPCSELINKKILVLEMVLLDNHWYYFSNNKLTWRRARSECKTRGLKLLRIETTKEEESLTNHLLHLPMESGQLIQFWTQGWSDFLVPPTQPHDLEIGNQVIDPLTSWCSELERLGDKLAWRKARCSHRKKFICKMPVTCEYWYY